MVFSEKFPYRSGVIDTFKALEEEGMLMHPLFAPGNHLNRRCLVEEKPADLPSTVEAHMQWRAEQEAIDQVNRAYRQAVSVIRMIVNMAMIDAFEFSSGADVPRIFKELRSLYRLVDSASDVPSPEHADNIVHLIRTMNDHMMGQGGSYTAVRIGFLRTLAEADVASDMPELTSIIQPPEDDVAKSLLLGSARNWIARGFSPKEWQEEINKAIICNYIRFWHTQEIGFNHERDAAAAATIQRNNRFTLSQLVEFLASRKSDKLRPHLSFASKETRQNTDLRLKLSPRALELVEDGSLHITTDDYTDEKAEEDHGVAMTIAAAISAINPEFLRWGFPCPDLSEVICTRNGTSGSFSSILDAALQIVAGEKLPYGFYGYNRKGISPLTTIIVNRKSPNGELISNYEVFVRALEEYIHASMFPLSRILWKDLAFGIEEMIVEALLGSLTFNHLIAMAGSSEALDSLNVREELHNTPLSAIIPEDHKTIPSQSKLVRELFQRLFKVAAQTGRVFEVMLDPIFNSIVHTLGKKSRDGMLTPAVINYLKMYVATIINLISDPTTIGSLDTDLGNFFEPQYETIHVGNDEVFNDPDRRTRDREQLTGVVIRQLRQQIEGIQREINEFGV
jgi:hypothetical protein